MWKSLLLSHLEAMQAGTHTLLIFIHMHMHTYICIYFVTCVQQNVASMPQLATWMAIKVLKQQQQHAVAKSNLNRKMQIKMFIWFQLQ